MTPAQQILFDEARVSATPGWPSIVLPSTLKLQLKHRNVVFEDGDWVVVFKPLMELRKELTHERIRDAGSSRNSTVVRVLAVGDVPQKSAVLVEARIRELSGAELVRVADASGVVVDVHPTNPGITAMRRKNSLLAMHRRGAEIRL